MAYYSEGELKALPFKSCGSNVQISKLATLYNPEQISIGSNVRIDDFCVLSGNIEIKNYVHLATHVVLTATRERILISNFSTLSYGTVAFTATDDFIGPNYSNPTLPTNFRNVEHLEIIIGEKCAIGAGSVILPGCILEEGVSLGALTLGKGRFSSWGVYVGHEKRKIHDKKPY